MELSLGGDGLLGEQVCGNLSEVPDNPQPGHDLQRVISNVNLPPEEALACRSHEVVMVIVPALAEGQQSEQPIVSAGICCLVAARTQKVRGPINCEGVMTQKHTEQAEDPHEKLAYAHQPQHH